MKSLILKYGVGLALMVFLASYATRDMALVNRIWLTVGATFFLAIGAFIGRNQFGGLSRNFRRNTYLAALSSREKEVAKLILSDYSNKEICEELCIEQSTLKSHINKIYQKCNAASRKEFKEKLGFI